MNAKHLGIGVVALGCVVAAGAGAYLGVRHNAAEMAGVETPATAAALEARPADAMPSAAGVATDAAARPEPALAPQRQVPVGRREEPRSRTLQTEVAATARPSVDAGTRRTAAAQPAAEAPKAAPMPAMVEPAPLPPPLVPVEQPPAPPAPRFEEVVVPADAVIGLRVENSVSSETARVEDTVTARVTRDVRVGGEVAIPAGSRVQGSVVAVVRGGKFKERARLGVRFHTLVTDNGAVPIQTEVVFREGESKAGESAAKMSAGAIGGAIIGGIVGGGKGAAIGSAAGAGAGTAVVAAGDRSEAHLAAGSNVTVRLSQPVVITFER